MRYRSSKEGCFRRRLRHPSNHCVALLTIPVLLVLIWNEQAYLSPFLSRDDDSRMGPRSILKQLSLDKIILADDDQEIGSNEVEEEEGRDDDSDTELSTEQLSRVKSKSTQELTNTTNRVPKAKDAIRSASTQEKVNITKSSQGEPRSPVSRPEATKAEKEEQPKYMELCDNDNKTIYVYNTLPDGSESKDIIMSQPTGPCGSLRRRNYWTNSNHRVWLKKSSDWAKFVDNILGNCTLPPTVYPIGPNSGIGSHLHQWSESVCQAGHDMGYRVQLTSNHMPWIWGDQTYCSETLRFDSPFHCYFKSIDSRCSGDVRVDTKDVFTKETNDTVFSNITFYHRRGKRWCTFTNGPPKIRSKRSAFVRAGSFEYLFRDVTPLLLREAERQVGLVFAETRHVSPPNLLVVHIRWGDKFKEMELIPIEKYTSAVQTLLQKHTGQSTRGHIYLATEDPLAAKAFKQDMKRLQVRWKVYLDRGLVEFQDIRPKRETNFASVTTKTSRGRMGLVNMASFLVMMEANMFVLTTGSSFSRVINGLRMNVLDRRCGNCTSMIDLQPGYY